MTESAKRNLVVVRAGDQSLHPQWLLPKEQRNWDLVVSYYGSNPTLYRSEDEIRIDHQGPKWRGLAALFDASKIDLTRYQNIWLPDDDLAISGESINHFFQVFDQLGLEIAQPALHWASYFSHPITLKNPNFTFRLTNFVEGMAPCLRRDLFDRVRHTFPENVSGWGIDIVWQRFLSRPVGASAIIDCVEITHTRPVGGPNYAHILNSGISALDEMRLVLEKYQMTGYIPAVLGGQTITDQWLSASLNRSQLIFECASGIAPRLREAPAQLGQYLQQLLSVPAPASESLPSATDIRRLAQETANHVSGQLFGLGPKGFNTEHFSHLTAAIDAARYRNEHLRQAPCFASAQALLNHALAQTKLPGMTLEFGVADGQSIRHIASQVASPVVGFDSFEGLPETWRPGFDQGMFQRATLPAVPANVRLVKGLFALTLPEFLRETDEPLSFVHIDCDLYSSTKTVLEALQSRIEPGVVIVFDEYLNFPGWQHDEFQAFQEFIKESGRRYRYIGQVPSHQQVAVIIE